MPLNCAGVDVKYVIGTGGVNTWSAAGRTLSTQRSVAHVVPFAPGVKAAAGMTSRRCAEGWRAGTYIGSREAAPITDAYAMIRAFPPLTRTSASFGALSAAPAASVERTASID